MVRILAEVVLMTPVKNPSALQVTIQGKNQNGDSAVLRISNEVTGKTHLRICGTNTWVDTEDLQKALAALYPVTGAKHAGTM